jgi:predicted phosphodiesterase
MSAPVLAALLVLPVLSGGGCSGSDPVEGDTTSSSDGGTANAGDTGAVATDAGSDDAKVVVDAWNPPVETGAVAFPYTAYRCTYPIRQVAPSKPAAAFHDATKVGAAPAVKNLHLSFAGDASSSIVVQWGTDDQTMGTEVRFGDSPTTLDKVAHGFSFAYGVAGRREHELHLCGLVPGHTYYYDAGAGTARSAVHSFVTAPADASEIKVLVMGDTRTDPTVVTAIAQHALTEGPDVMIQSGDAVESGTSQAQWDALFGAAPNLFAEVPCYWVHGNHEGLSEVYFALHALPDNGTANGIEEWFAATYGPMRLVVLNDTLANNADLNGAEKTFLTSALTGLDRNRTPFAITSHHQPMYTTSSSHPSNTAVRGAWAPVFDQHHVNIDIAGHVHSYESTKPLSGGTAASTGATTTDALGTRYITFGGGGAPLYKFLASQPYLQKRESTHGYAIVTIGATSLKWVSRRQDGTEIETITLAK